MEILDTPKEVEGQFQRPKKKEISRRARAWDHFTLYTDKSGKSRAKCKYCDKNYAADPLKNGTSGMNNHMKSVTGGFRDACSIWKFDQEAIRKSLVRMIIKDELPFKFVENEGFREFMSIACPQFVVPSRTTITRDCYKLYFDEKNKLKTYFKTSGQRLSLTTDAWTSNQRLTYLCLTGHYIDDDWKIRDEVGLLIEKCLLDWELDKIFTITVDNASSNDTTIAYLKRRFLTWGTAILGDKYLHMRCVAHIINLVVKDGLKEFNESIERVRTVMRYVRQSPVRLKKFNDFVVEEKVESKKSLCLDVPTRWNSVYTMLETAVIFKGVFDRYEVSDADFRADFMLGGPYANIGLPTKDDWVVVERFVKVFRYFYEFTLRVSGSLFVTSNTFIDEISDVDELLRGWLKSDDNALVDMARKMKLKFDKYWGNMEKMNMMLYIADILTRNMYGSERGEHMRNLTKIALYDIFEEYKTLYSSVTSSCYSSVSMENTTPSESKNDNEAYIRAIRVNKKRYMQMLSEIGVDQSELDLYLQEPIAKDSPNFDIVDWWKVNSHRFPILCRLTRDVLAMPISTVASESVFSIGGRIIDDFRASLTPKMAQALICCQDWLRHTLVKSLEEDYEFIQRIEKGIILMFTYNS
ncbi:hypothetical protein Pfo_030975 [Paulownia fortunei]|nr:hypothetical protein Pfo_030975 [Paulownia fortunei]